MPEKPVNDQPADGPEYRLHFTDKSLDDLAALNFYELEHALYAAWRSFDQTRARRRLPLSPAFSQYTRNTAGVASPGLRHPSYD